MDYDALLAKILALPKVKETLNDLRTDEEWNKQWHWTEYHFETNAIENFMDEPWKTILAIPEIWEDIKRHVREIIEDRTYDAEMFIAEGAWIKVEDLAIAKLEEIENELYRVIDRKYGKK